MTLLKKTLGDEQPRPLNRLHATQEADASDKTTRADELVGIFDKLISSIGDMLELPGVDEQETEQAHYSARLISFQALRVLYMGEAFRAQRSWPEAYVLYERSTELAGASMCCLSDPGGGGPATCGPP